MEARYLKEKYLPAPPVTKACGSPFGRYGKAFCWLLGFFWLGRQETWASLLWTTPDISEWACTMWLSWLLSPFLCRLWLDTEISMPSTRCLLQRSTWFLRLHFSCYLHQRWAVRRANYSSGGRGWGGGLLTVILDRRVLLMCAPGGGTQQSFIRGRVHPKL